MVDHPNSRVIEITEELLSMFQDAQETIYKLTMANSELKQQLDNRALLQARIDSQEKKIAELYRQLDYIRNARNPG